MPALQPTKHALVLDQDSAEDRKAPVALSSRNTYFAAFPFLLYILVAGYVTSYPAPATVDMKAPGSRFRHITADEITWIASMPMISGIFGNAFSGFATQYFGRKAWLIQSSALYTLGWLVITYAPSVPFLYLGRILCGFSAASSIVTIPTYLVEISPTEIRGRMTTLFHVALSLGMVLVMALGMALRWSWLAAAGAGLIVSAAVLMLFVPESPPWLVREGRTGEAAAGLRFLRRRRDVRRELQDLVEGRSTGDAQKAEGFKLKEVLDKSFYKPVGIAVALMFFQTFSGMAAVMVYTVDIFQKTGSSIQPNVASVTVAAVQLLGTIVSSFLMDRTGRRPLYLISGCFVTASLVSIGAYSLVVSRNANFDVRLYGWIPLLCLVVFIFTFALGLGPVPFVLAPEIAPLRTRSLILAISALALSFFGFVVIKMYDAMQGILGVYGLYWFYSAVSFISIVFGVFVLPETKGMSLQDIQDKMAL